MSCSTISTTTVTTTITVSDVADKRPDDPCSLRDWVSDARQEQRHEEISHALPVQTRCRSKGVHIQPERGKKRAGIEVQPSRRSASLSMIQSARREIGTAASVGMPLTFGWTCQEPSQVVFSAPEAYERASS